MMKIDCSRQLVTGQTDRHADSISRAPVGAQKRGMRFFFGTSVEDKQINVAQQKQHEFVYFPKICLVVVCFPHFNKNIFDML